MKVGFRSISSQGVAHPSSQNIELSHNIVFHPKEDTGNMGTYHGKVVPPYSGPVLLRILQKIDEGICRMRETTLFTPSKKSDILTFG